jgi:hypothetical protein
MLSSKLGVYCEERFQKGNVIIKESNINILTPPVCLSLYKRAHVLLGTKTASSTVHSLINWNTIITSRLLAGTA